jgi:predicted acylesterase/phospholipase RssA
VLLLPGALVWCAGVAFLVAGVETTPAFLTQWLPAMAILGVGAGAVFPTLSSAAVAAAPGERFAIATSLNSVARQLGAVLGVAMLVALIGTPSPDQAAAAFDRGWAFAGVSFLIVAVGSIFLGRVEQHVEPAEAPSPPPTLATRRRTPSVTVGAGAAARVSAFLAESSTPTRQSPAEFLRSVPLFADLPDEQREEVLGRSSRVHLRAGAWLFREGDPADGLYVVRSGRIELVQEDGGTLVLGKGAVLGELGLVSQAPRSASVRAVRDTELLELARDAFDELLRESPGFALALVRVLSDRLRASRAYPAPRRPVPTTVALVPLEGDLPVRDLANRLADSFDRVGRISLLDGSERSIEDGDDPSAVYGPMFDRLEHSHERALLVATTPTGEDPWTDVCVQQADRILALTRGGRVPEWLSDVPALQGCDLVCCRSRTANWAPWAAALRPANTHRLALGDDEGADLDRIARRLSGRSVGIVLSGGGARAFAHIGVIEELLAAGVEIDRVGGASMGAFVGGLLAMGMSPAEIDAHCYEEWVTRNPLNDYTLPRIALVRGDKVTAMVDRSFAGLSVEDTELNFYAVSAELRTGELIVHRHGSLFRAIGASMSLPVLVPPQLPPTGQVLVDGGVINNLPVDAMAATGEGPIVAVDVKPKSRQRGREAAADNGKPAVREARAPKLLETLYRVILLGSASTSDLAQRYADVVIQPRVEGVGLLEWHQIDQAREAGRQAAREVLEDLPQALLI